MSLRVPDSNGKPRRRRNSEKGGGIPGVVTNAPADSPTGVGRPAIVIDETVLYTLALTHASFEHMGVILGVSYSTLSDERLPWRGIIEKARAQKKADLLAAQFDTAIVGRNPTMQIWLGKQYLDQKDVQRVENTGPDGQPQQLEIAAKAVAYFPVNNRNKKLPSGTATLAGPNGPVDVEVELEDAPDA